MSSKQTDQADHNVQHQTIIDISNLKKVFEVGKGKVDGLRGIDLKIKATDFLVIFGPSGCGKSTLLNTIAGVEPPTSGGISIRDVDIYSLADDERATFRAQKMGIVHQLPYWVKSLNVLDNVALPLLIAGESTLSSRKHALEVLKELKVSDLCKQVPSQLSGGQQQKVGIARALVSNPWILMADEPTGNLDSTSSDEIIAIFDQLNKKHKRTIIMVTHNQAYWSVGTRRIEMMDGKIIREEQHHE